MTAASFASMDRAPLHAIVAEEMREWDIGGISLALIHDGKIVYANGYGEAERGSVFRVGSVSKLLNAIAVMQEVERGGLHLDAPILAALLPLNPFPETAEITLRHLLSHRSGLQRESSVGGYFDNTQPGLEATVKSLASGVLVSQPGAKARYSNIGPSLAGYLVEKASGLSFEDYQQRHILGRLDMTESAWTLARLPKGKEPIVSHMRIADGKGGWRRRETPVFDLGTLPAGNFYSTVDDLSKLAFALLAEGGGLISQASLVEMWRPQFTEAACGFGLGFMVGTFGEHRMVSHGGAVYGHSAAFALLPEQKLAVIVLGNEDIANGRIARISNFALSLLLKETIGECPPGPLEENLKVDPSVFAGSYESESFWAELKVSEGRLVGEISGQSVRLDLSGPSSFIANSRTQADAPLVFEQEASGRFNRFTYAGQTFERVPDNPPPLPASWRKCLGSYGPDFIPLIVSERHGHLYAMTENMVDYRMIPLNHHACSLPPGMYADEQAIFLTNPDGTIHSINFANMLLRRNPSHPETITP